MWQTFGHNNAKNILQKQLDQQQLAHAYLFTGPAGIGKLSLALEFAKRIVNATSVHPDILSLDLAEDSSVESVRQFLARTNYSPVASDRLVAVINNFHLASNVVSNSLLKTLEEPSAKTVIILVSATKQLLPTILSRVQNIPFNALTTDELRNYLEHQKSVKTDSDIDGNISLEQALQLANGSIVKLDELLGDKDKLSELVDKVEQLDGCLSGSDYQRSVMVNRLAEYETEELSELLQSWIHKSRTRLGENPNIAKSIRLAMQVDQKLKQNLNKKMVLTHFLLNAKV